MAKELTLNLQDFGEDIKFAMVEPKTLNIDHSYQRDETDLVDLIAANFNPLAFGCALVAQRSDGSRYLVDAQQRTKGAIAAGKKLVPALIFKSKGKEQEAQIFRYLNEFRKPVTLMDIFRASLVAGDPETVGINTAVQEAGFKVALKSGLKKWPYIGAVEQLRMIYKKHQNGQMLQTVLLMIKELWPGEYEALRRESIRAVYAFVQSFGETVDHDRLTEKFKGNPMAAILNQAATDKARARNKGDNMPMFQAVFGVIRRIYGKPVPPVDKAWPIHI